MVKLALKKITRKFGFNVTRYNPSSVNKPTPTYAKKLLYEADPTFQGFYSQGVKISGTPDPQAVALFSKRQERFYNLAQFLMQTMPLDGKLIECGCWKGLSSYVMCNYMRKHDSTFMGKDFLIVDSFEGLSEPSEFDRIADLAVTGKEEKSGQPVGSFAASLQEVKNTLSSFPEITYFKGWIPSVFKDLPEAKYKFVHVDVDLYEPVHASIEYFYPRLVDGGIIVFDDYGSLYWPGAKKAVDEYCEKNSISFLRLSTAQAVIWKK